MKNRAMFYLFIAALVVLDSVLLRTPNLLGKIGLIIYKYHYLRTFPKALFTVTAVVLIAIILSEGICWLFSHKMLSKKVAVLLLSVFLLASIGMFVKTVVDFMAWSYSHTGLRFRLGAYLLPLVLVTVFGYGLVNLFKIRIIEIEQSVDVEGHDEIANRRMPED